MATDEGVKIEDEPTLRKMRGSRMQINRQSKNSVACELSFKSVDRNSSDVTKLDASSPQKRTPSGKCLGFLLPHWTGRHWCRGMGVPPILVPEQQCADKVQSRACEFSFSHLVGGEPEACSPLRSLMSQTRLTLCRCFSESCPVID